MTQIIINIIPDKHGHGGHCNCGEGASCGDESCDCGHGCKCGCEDEKVCCGGECGDNCCGDEEKCACGDHCECGEKCACDDEHCDCGEADCPICKGQKHHDEGVEKKAEIKSPANGDLKIESKV